MIEILWFEVKKLLSKKIVLIGIAALVVYNIILFMSASLPSISVMLDKDSGKYANGAEAIEMDKEITKRYEGILTDEKVQEMLAEFMPSESMRQRIADFPTQIGIIEVQIHMNSMQEAVHEHFANPDGTWNGLTVQDVFGNAEIQVGYNTGWLQTCNYMIQIIMALGVLMIIIVAPLFSGEYSGMDTLILTSKYGRTKCVSAKLAASFLGAFIITAAFILINFGMAFIIFGSDGLSSSVAFNALSGFRSLPYDMTCKTLMIYEIILAFTSVFAVTAVTIILSAICKNPFITLVTAAAVHILPILFPISEHSPLYKYVVFSPIYQGQTVSILSLGNIAASQVPQVILTLPVVAIFCIISYVVSKRVFSYHQVS